LGAGNIEGCCFEGIDELALAFGTVDSWNLGET
jgi:hypothetical protein